MRKSFLLICASLLAFHVYAQGTGWDMQAFSSYDIVGTSRYVGLGGAMTALGGDVSAIKDNPAALGVFHRSETSITIGWRVSDTYQAQSLNSTIHSFIVPQVTQVFASPGASLTGIGSNFVLSYQRLADFSRDWEGGMTGLRSSQTDLMAFQAGGLRMADLKPADAYDDAEVGWLSKLGFDAHLIYPTGDADGSWTSLEPGNTRMTNSVSERGYIDNFSFGWGANTGDIFYFGLLLNFKNLNYDKYSTHAEAFESGNVYSMSSSVIAKGFGFDFGAGIICRPTSNFRLGASVLSPTFMRIHTRTSGEISSRIAIENMGVQHYSPPPPSGYEEVVARKLPMRFTLGAAVSFGTRGLLSSEYDWQGGWETSLRNEHMLKLGAELVVRKNVFLDLGYAAKLYGNFRADEDIYLPTYNSARTDTEYAIDRVRHYASVGASYRHNFFTMGIAYQFGAQWRDLYAYAGVSNDGQSLTPETYHHLTHNVVLSFALKY